MYGIQTNPLFFKEGPLPSPVISSSQSSQPLSTWEKWKEIIWTLSHPREVQFQRRFILPRSHMLEMSLFSSLLALQRAGGVGEGPSPWEKFTDVFKSKPYQWNFPFPPGKGYSKDPHFFFFLNIVSCITLETSLGMCLRLLFGNNIFSAAVTHNAPVTLGNAQWNSLNHTPCYSLLPSLPRR